MDYRDDPDFKDFIEYNDLGLPLAYTIANGIVDSSSISERYVEEAFDVLLAGLNLEDKGFETLTEVLEAGE
jgi:hypothetical protein